MGFMATCTDCGRDLPGIRPHRVRKKRRRCFECHLEAQPKIQRHCEGYVVIRTGTRERKLEHRVVMERMLGRPLKKGEVVHHKNGVKDDNRPENLELCQSPGKHASEHHRMSAFFKGPS